MTYAWSPEAEEDYERVRLLGSGAFSSIWFAKPKNEEARKKGFMTLKSACPVHSGASDELVEDDQSSHECPMCENVALKTTAIHTRDNPDNALAYAVREVAILKKLNHSHIMKVINEYPLSASDRNTGNKKPGERKEGETIYYSVALSLAMGPTVDQIVDEGGALGLPMARLISCQLVSAVAYLHSHAVIHRDIKPDNMIVVGAIKDEDTNWCDDYNNAKVKELTGVSLPTSIGTHRVWHLVLVDFGFARALSPSDVSDDIGLYKAVNVDHPAEDLKDHPATHHDTLDSKLLQGKGVEWDRKRTKLLRDESVSELRIMDMSAVGNKDYAAPEILKNLRKYEESTRSGSNMGDSGRGVAAPGGAQQDSSLHSSATAREKNENEGKFKRKTTRLSILGKNRTEVTRKGRRQRPLGQNVADYGMVADAYSVGAVLRYILTGVPPNHNIDDYIGLYESPAAVAVQCFFSLFQMCKRRKNITEDGGGDSEDTTGKKRKKRFRRNDQVPREATSLVCSLTLWNEHKRCTVRAAMHHPWIVSGPNDPNEESALPVQAYTHQPVEFLDLTDDL